MFYCSAAGLGTSCCLLNTAYQENINVSACLVFLSRHQSACGTDEQLGAGGVCGGPKVQCRLERQNGATAVTTS